MGDQLKAVVMIQQRDYVVPEQKSGSSCGEQYSDSRYVLKEEAIEFADGMDVSMKGKEGVTVVWKVFGLSN